MLSGGSRLSAVPALVACLVLAACSTGTSRPPAPPATPDLPSAAEATDLLRDLAVGPRTPDVAAYDRDAFGGAWADTDCNGCNQRGSTPTRAGR